VREAFGKRGEEGFLVRVDRLKKETNIRKGKRYPNAVITYRE
jgi:hypothetical protein